MAGELPVCLPAKGKTASLFMLDIGERRCSNDAGNEGRPEGKEGETHDVSIYNRCEAVASDNT